MAAIGLNLQSEACFLISQYGSIISQKIKNDGIYDWLNLRFPEKYKRLVLCSEIENNWNYYHSVPRLKSVLSRLAAEWDGVIAAFNKQV